MVHVKMNAEGKKLSVKEERYFKTLQKYREEAEAGNGGDVKIHTLTIIPRLSGRFLNFPIFSNVSGITILKVWAELYQNNELRNEVIDKGIHRFLNFNGLIATDSGAFQHYMYNNKKFELDAKTIEIFQEEIGSDFPVILDVPVQINDNYETAKSKVITTINRAKENIKRRTSNDCYWFGPIHGGYFQDLLEKSIREMSKLNFSIFALGGLVKLLLDYRFDIVYFLSL